MEVCEALGVQHVHFVHKQHPGDQLGYALVDVAVHHLVDLSSELICDWCRRGGTTSATESETVLKQTVIGAFLFFLYL